MNNLSLSKFMRALHRDLGALVIGLTLIFSISGIVLIYRNIDFLKFPQEHEKQLDKNLSVKALKEELKIRRFRLSENTEEKIVFESGSYDKGTGLAQYTTKSYPSVLEKFTQLHKANSGKIFHWVTLTYGISLFLLAFTSLWMYKPGTKKFKRFISITAIGASAALIVLLLI